MSRGAAVVLLVEDDTDSREMLAMWLELDGYRVLQAENGAEALRVLAEAGVPRPAMILLDLEMPVMDGERFLEIQERDAQFGGIPVAWISASPRVEEVAARHRRLPVLRKPCDVEAVSALIDGAANGCVGTA
jgi:two-component system response regulator CpxR